MKRYLIILTTAILTTAANGQVAKQGDAIRKAIEERRRLAETQKKIEDSNSYQSEENNFDLSSGKMYSQLLTFHYEPSQRDPFISVTVISPFVSEEVIEEVSRDEEKIKESIKTINSFLQGRIQLQGMAYGRMGTSYAVANNDVILKPGEYMPLPLEEEDQTILKTAATLAVEAGAEVKIKTWRNALLIKVLAVKDKTVEFETPGFKDTFTVPFVKTTEIETIPSPVIEEN